LPHGCISYLIRTDLAEFRSHRDCRPFVHNGRIPSGRKRPLGWSRI
jgi:hypothetical protein